MTYKILVKTFSGLEDVLETEIQQLGVSKIVKAKRAVRFEGTIEDIYKANLTLRTAIRVLVELKHFKIENEQDLYKVAKQIPWENYFTQKNTFAVYSNSNSKLFKHTNYPSLLVKDAIADSFREKFGARPNVNKDNPDIVIDVYINENRCTLSMDSSGQSLHRRGYKKEIGKAPLNEVLAAGLVLLSDWDKKSTFVDPMAGSGTIPIEAALIAKNIPVNLTRTNFSFMNWENYDFNTWNKIKNELRRKILKTDVRIISNDISTEMTTIAKANANNAGVDEIIEFSISPLHKLVLPDERKFIVTNPPYNERLKITAIDSFYANIGNSLKNNFTNSSVWILTGFKNAVKKIGLRPSKHINLFNGKIEAKFLHYDIYEGSRKRK